LKASLRTLRSGDRFRIQLFDNFIDWYHRGEAIPFTQDAVDQADRFLSSVQGRGGTEIVEAVNAALDLPQEAEHQRMIVLLTDGSVSGEERALDLVRRKLKSARLFTFGIGPSVNRAFIQRLAQLGRGTAEFLGLNEDIEGAIIRFQDRLSFPMLVDLKLDWGESAVRDVYPRMLPDLYADQPLILTGRCSLASEKSLSFKVRGRRGSERVELDTTLRLLDQPETSIQRLWARNRVDDLIEEGKLDNLPEHQVRDQVIGLALQHRLVTPYTSFVAVDSQVVADSSIKPQILIAQPLPEGLDLAGFVSYQTSNIVSADIPDFDAVRSEGAEFEVYASPPVPIREDVYDLQFLSSDKQKMKEEGARSQGELLLRELVRTQLLNGSWEENVELTMAVLLLFLKNGHSPRRGHFRTQLQRSFDWLLAEPTRGDAEFLRVYAFHKLAQTDGYEYDWQTAEQLRQALPRPANRLQRAIWDYLQEQGYEGELLSQVNSLEDLWLAVIFNSTDLLVSPSLAHDTEPRLVETLLAALHHRF
jgi:Ca-activated chloride channel homolog